MSSIPSSAGRRAGRGLGVVMASLLLGGCVSVRVGAGSDPSQIRMDGLASGYASVSALPSYDGTLLKAGTLGHADRDGEWVAIDLWPIGGVGIGLVGARLRVLPVEVALGTLFYHPELGEDDDAPDAEEGRDAPAEADDTEE